MSKTHCELKVSFTALDPEDLPDGMYSAEVVAELQTFLDTALDSWFAGRGKELVCFEPMVSVWRG